MTLIKVCREGKLFFYEITIWSQISWRSVPKSCIKYGAGHGVEGCEAIVDDI